MDSRKKNEKYRIFKAQGQVYVQADESTAFTAFLKANGVAHTSKMVGAAFLFKKGEQRNE